MLYRGAFREFPESIFLALVLVFLLSTAPVTNASVYCSLVMQASTPVTTSPVILQNGTAGTSTIYTNNTSAKVNVEAGNWLSGWGRRVKISIDHNDVDTGLSDFPIMVHLSNSSSGRNSENVSFVFDELQSDANRKKIAATSSDGVTQTYIEIERWEAATEQAWLWVKVPNLSNTTDTVLYLYFDKDVADNTNYVGDPNSTAAEKVWDSNFKAIHHVEEDPSGSITDSTNNQNDMNSVGGMSSSNLVDANIGKGVSYDGGNDAYIGQGNITLTQFTFSSWINGSNFSSWRTIATIGEQRDLCLNTGLLTFWADDVEYSFGSTLATGVWHHVAVTYDGTTLKGYINGSDTGNSYTPTLGSYTETMQIARWLADYDYFNGVLDEIRISNQTRTAAWIKASYESGRDDLVDFGPDEIKNFWSAEYNYRKQLTITNNIVSTLGSGYTVLLMLDTASLVSSGKMLSNGNDLRILHWNGGTWVELDRDVANMNSNSTQIWFKTQATIPANGADSNYYIYYGNPHAGSPPADWAKIYAVGDNFNDGSITSGLNATINGNASISESGGEVFMDLGMSDGDAGMIVTNNSLPSDKQFMVRLKVKLVSVGAGQELKSFSFNQWNGRPTVSINTVYNPTRRIHVLQYATYLRLVYEGVGGRRYWNGTSWTLTSSSLPCSLNTYYIWEFISNGTDWYIIWRYANETTIEQTDVVPWSSITDDGYDWWFLWSEAYTNYYWGDMNADFFLLRNYADPEPAVTSDAEERISYNYVLRVKNTVTDSWQIRLKEYSASSIGRLQNCTIYFHNSTDGASNQIVIENGALVNETGVWYNLGSLETIYIALMVEANSTGTSYVYVYLEVLIPGTTTYAQYIITFEVT